MKISDYIAKFLVEKKVNTVFTITGSGDVRLIDSVESAGIKYICPHHEQAGVMASLVKTRSDGTPAVCMVTGGPGASNTLIAIADAHLDSIPCIIIAGQENLEYVNPDNEMRGKGVQGLNMPDILKTVTKFAECLTDPTDIKRILEQAFYEAYSNRPGPVWIEIPQNLQWKEINPDTLKGFSPTLAPTKNMEKEVTKTLALIKDSKRPLIWVGHGVRLAGCENELRELVAKLGIPTLASWPAADIITDDNPLFVGRAGTYGQRFGNLALQNCDLLITLGTRLALPQRGYNDNLFARAAKKVIVEIDPVELEKFKFHIDVPVLGNVADFIDTLKNQLDTYQSLDYSNWLNTCRRWKKTYPMSIPPRNPTLHGINSYWFIDRLSENLNKDHVIVTDMGTSLTCTHAAIKLKQGQRLMTSTGLGEMGFGLPGAIGAALGYKNRPVVLITGEGGLMMNLQELQTLKNLNLPIKIFLINNNGYLTIKHTHNALYNSNGAAQATGPSSGVTFPDFEKVVTAFGLKFKRKSTAENLDEFIKETLETPECVVAEIIMPEFQELIPKLSLKKKEDGTVYSAPLEDMYPFLSKELLASEMFIPLIEE